MRILMVGMEWFPNGAGGLSRYFYEMVHALASEGVEGTAIVTALRQGDQAPTPFALRAMAPEGAGSGARWRGVRACVREELRSGRYDLINPHFALYAYPWLSELKAGSSDSRSTSLPMICNFQGPWAIEMKTELQRKRAGGEAPRAVSAMPAALKNQVRLWMAHKIEVSVYRRARNLITLSQAFADLACREYGVIPERIRVIPGAVDTRPYKAAPHRRVARERLGWPDNRPILLSVRRLAQRMGLENLLTAVRLLRSAHPNILLLIGGRGALADVLQAQIVAENLQDNVRLLGFIPDADLPTAYAAADITVVPTVALEGFGLTTVESLAAGTPVLGTDIGGTPEILRGLSADLVFASPSPEAMTDRVDAVLRGEISLPDADACREYVARYDWTNVLPQILKTFSE